MSFNPLISLARNAKRQRMEMQCDPQWVLDLAAERDQLRAELEAIRGQQPDAVSVPRELLERVAAILGSQGFSAWDELAAEVLLSTKNAEEDQPCDK